MRRFLVQDEIFGATVFWCKGTQCDTCKLRYLCFTQREDFTITKHRENLGRYKFNGEWLPLFLEGYHWQGGEVSHLGGRRETMIEWLMAGEKAQYVPDGQWTQEWVFQASVQCPEKVTARQVIDANFNKLLKKVMFPCVECHLRVDCQTERKR